MMSDSAPIRILDASLNRAAEGLRVVEDYVRFVLDDRHLTEQFKQLRHDLAAAGSQLPLPERHAARDTRSDVGTTVSTPSEGTRREAWEVCIASLERVKQSLRSLEEFSKVSLPAVAAEFERLRYWLYTLEAAVGRTVDANERLGEARLYVLVDGCDSEAAFAALVDQLIAARVGVIQLRDKRLDDRELIARARQLVAACQTPSPHTPPISPDLARSGLAPTRSSPLVIINDRPDVAAIVGADGVHLGQDDMRVKDARAIVGPRQLIGVSTHSIEQARAAVLDGANYLGVGPTFPSQTKSFDAFPGLDFVQQVAAEIRLPAFAIGGITQQNVGEVAAAGLRRIAVASAVTAAPRPQAAAEALRTALHQ
ncbi:thiamine phosphate synthase [Lacipirellula parvula]|uniref:Thiamine-phosphate synthase n=1 Tax=Lacipirellula parvula TaxID=2650471 RepID=A0A5K7XG90_9BACT|nr:thiamine phosphate synthase [Lacipirellula parvula]BBO35415.1 putative alternative hydroxymethylpyrimidine phosphate kinase ThiD [Lacipirellula parvula]